MAENEIALADMGEVLRKRVRDALFSAIPEGQVDALIKREFNDFFEKPTKTSKFNQLYQRWEETVGPPKFHLLIEEEINTQVKPLIQKAVQNRLYACEIIYGENGNGEPRLKDDLLVDAIVEKAAPLVIEAFLNDLVARVLATMRQLQ